MPNLIIGALIIGWAPVFVKLIGSAVGPAFVGAWRTGIAALVIGIVLALSGGLKPLRKPGALRLWLPPMIGAGVFFGLDLFLWHQAIPLVGAGLATVLANTQVLHLGAFATLRGEQKLDRRYLAAVGAAFFGVILLASESIRPSAPPNLSRGLMFGVATGFLYAGYVLSLKRANRQFKPALNLAGSSMISSVMLLTLGFFDRESQTLTPTILTLLIALGLVAHVAGWLLITRGLATVTAARAGVVLLLQPCVATLVGVLLLHERLTLLQCAGAALTLAGIWFESRRPKATRSSPASESA